MWFRWLHLNLCPSPGPDCWWGRGWPYWVGADGIIVEHVRGVHVSLRRKCVCPLVAGFRAANRVNAQQAAAKEKTHKYEKNDWRERGNGGDGMLVKAHLGISV